MCLPLPGAPPDIKLWETLPGSGRQPPVLCAGSRWHGDVRPWRQNPQLRVGSLHVKGLLPGLWRMCLLRSQTRCLLLSDHQDQLMSSAGTPVLWPWDLQATVPGIPAPAALGPASALSQGAALAFLSWVREAPGASAISPHPNRCHSLGLGPTWGFSQWPAVSSPIMHSGTVDVTQATELTWKWTWPQVLLSSGLQAARGSGSPGSRSAQSLLSDGPAGSLLSSTACCRPGWGWCRGSIQVPRCECVGDLPEGSRTLGRAAWLVQKLRKRLRLLVVTPQVKLLRVAEETWPHPEETRVGRGGDWKMLVLKTGARHPQT
ncbi:uncharacterized protein LOC117976201 [Pan paniscus]|uniref:uncharacterized protein LOC117976201 n=1 Tax=Pan paniscus TaxID=9597 RepID=UPI00155FB740|nr:uncharacterized protein LOC117976201 [Pan paniscus]